MRFDHAMAEILKQSGSARRNQGIIIDQQYRSRWRDRVGRLTLDERIGFAVRYRQPEFCHRAHTKLALQAKCAAGLIGKPVNLRETKARTLADSFGRKKRFDCSSEGREVHTLASVLDRKSDVSARCQLQ